MIDPRDALRQVLPEDAAHATLVGRVWRPEVKGPSVVAIRDGVAFDISGAFPTMRDLCEAADPAKAARAAAGEPIPRSRRCWPIPRRTHGIRKSPVCWRRRIFRRSRRPG